MNNVIKLPENILNHYVLLKKDIKKRLVDFKKVPESEYFYELCFCLCTPQSKAENALQVVEELKKRNFLSKKFNPKQILFNKKHYIRFHKTKSLRLVRAIELYPEALKILNSKQSVMIKRELIQKMILGFGMKESSHFMRNIGYRNFAILDRHILKHLVLCGLLDDIPKISSINQYLEIENIFQNFAESINIPIDELDLLFWSYETGKILK
ncbi:MAG: DNA lyase [FCB group bacterium]|jgi:N-glycosylase/DNA lyase